MHIDTLRTMGRATQGVRLINLKGTAEIAAIARVPRTEDEDEDIEVIEALNEVVEDLGPIEEENDEVIGMICVEDIFSTILVVSEKGYGKRTYLNDPEDKEPVYRITNRGGKV